MGLTAMWCNAQLISGFLVAGLPTLPRFFRYLHTKPWCIRLESRITNKLRSSSSKVTKISARVTTIGGGGRNRGGGKKQISDAEFHELVIETDLLGSASYFPGKGAVNESVEVRGVPPDEHGSIDLGDLELNLNGLA